MKGPFQKIRADICDAYIAAGKPKSEVNWVYSRLVEAKAENERLATVLSEVYALGSTMEQPFAAGVHMAVEEIAERLGIEAPATQSTDGRAGTPKLVATEPEG